MRPLLALLLLAGCSHECVAPSPTHAFLGGLWLADEDVAERAGGMPACFVLLPSPTQEARILWADGVTEGPYPWLGDGAGGFVFADTPAGELRLAAVYAGADTWDVTARHGVLAVTWRAERCPWL